MKRCSFSLNSKTISALKALSEKTELKMSDLLRRALEEYVKRENGKLEKKAGT